MKWYRARAILNGAIEGIALLLIFASIYALFAILGGPAK